MSAIGRSAAPSRRPCPMLSVMFALDVFHFVRNKFHCCPKLADHVFQFLGQSGRAYRSWWEDFLAPPSFDPGSAISHF